MDSEVDVISCVCAVCVILTSVYHTGVNFFSPIYVSESGEENGEDWITPDLISPRIVPLPESHESVLAQNTVET